MTSPGRVAFNIFGLDVMWYGITMATGMMAAGILAYLRAEKAGLDKERVIDIVLYCIPAGALGSRIYYVIFEWGYYSKHIGEILNFRSGGLAIHGGLIAGVGLGLYLAKRWKINKTKYMDLAAPSIAIAQSIGRWGNFFNSEAHGGPTDLPWAVLVNGVPVHPTFLYESIWCFLLCIFLVWYDHSGFKKFDGQIFLLYASLYSAERFFVEGLRTDSLMIGPFRQAQLFSLTVIAVCVFAYYFMNKRNSKREGEQK
ncbi:MAG: prolipoprotein diacylglyceryl transferase [Clostridia bacterium]|nr:prolipoprotein diacylglyceryl transferase [Clostridia bacterium]